MSEDRLADRIRTWGLNVRDFFHAGQRATLMSPLFNVPGRLIVGGYCYYEHLPWILPEIERALGPQEIGGRMKGIGVRPNYVALNALMLGFFNGREQVRLVGGTPAGEPLPGERRVDLETVLDFWERAARAYVEDESPLVADLGYRLPVLPAEGVEALTGRLRAPSAEERSVIRRMIAVTELYTFILNGEARVGVFHHGPYDMPDGEQLIVKELVGLREEFLPWQLDERPPVDSLARVMVLKDVGTKIDLYGSLVAEPFEYEDRIVAETLVTPEDDGLRELGLDEVAEIERIAADGQVRMYEQASSWSQRYQIAYGADLYAALLIPFARLAGVDLEERIERAFHETAERVAPRLESGEEQPLVLKALGSTEGEPYSTAVPAAG